MTTLREAAQQALEVLKSGLVVYWHSQVVTDFEAALAEPVQEPDYWQEEARSYAGNADYWRKRYEALAEPESPIGQASTDVPVPVYVVKKAEPPCNPSCAPGYCYCEPVEPVAWRWRMRNLTDAPGFVQPWTVTTYYPREQANEIEPLYAAPPQRKPLSAIDLRALYDRYAACQEEGPEISGWWDFARAVEAAHGIKEAR
jgi:hypothetical protein